MRDDDKVGYWRVTLVGHPENIDDPGPEGVPLNVELLEKGQDLTQKLQRHALELETARLRFPKRQLADEHIVAKAIQMEEHIIRLSDYPSVPETPSPPSSYLAELLAPPEKGADFVANLEEVHWDRWVAKYGLKRARILWYVQIGHFALKYWLGVAVDIVKLMPKT